MKNETIREGVIVVVYRDREGTREFLSVLNKRSGNWTWVSGGTDGEPHKTAATRELKEETDLDPVQLIETDLTHSFRYGSGIDGKGTMDPGEQKIFVAGVDAQKEVVIPPDEIADSQWFAFEDAKDILTFSEHVTILETLRTQNLV